MSTIQITNINDLSDNASLVTQNGGIKTDKLTGTTTAGSILVTGEGNSTTTNLQQGLAKCWHSMDGSGTVATFDSFNVASIFDSGTGNYGRTFTNPFSNDDYASTTSASYTGGGVKCGSMDSTSGETRSGGSTRYNNRTFNTSGNDADAYWINATCHGDLA